MCAPSPPVPASTQLRAANSVDSVPAAGNNNAVSWSCPSCPLTGLGHQRPLWLAVHTQPGEEDLVAAAHVSLTAQHPGLCTVIVPADRARCREVAAMLRGKHSLRVGLDGCQWHLRLQRVHGACAGLSLPAGKLSPARTAAVVGLRKRGGFVAASELKHSSDGPLHSAVIGSNFAKCCQVAFDAATVPAPVSP